MAAAVSRKSLPSLPPLLSASTCTMGKGRGEDSNLVLTPTVTSPMSPPLWPSLGSQLMAELSERLASGDGSACDGESENDESEYRCKLCRLNFKLLILNSYLPCPCGKWKAFVCSDIALMTSLRTRNDLPLRNRTLETIIIFLLLLRTFRSKY